MESIYCSSVSGPTLRLGLRLDKTGVPNRTDSYSVTTTVPGTGSSITSMIVSSTGTSTACLGAFLAAVFGVRFFLAAAFGVVLAARTLDLAFFDVVGFAAFLRAGLALALPRPIATRLHELRQRYRYNEGVLAASAFSLGVVVWVLPPAEPV
jgi:hypothetical protein